MEIRSKDSQIFIVLGPLIEAVADKEEEVKSEICLCIRELSKSYPDEVLQTICTYKKNHSKLTGNHIISLLQTAESVCKDAEVLSNIDPESTVCPLVKLAISEMTHSPDLIPASQLPASQLLVALSKQFCEQVMEGVLGKFHPGVVPHYFVIFTLGSLASANSFAMVPYMKACLGTMLPMMGALRTDPLKQAFAYTLGRFADAIQDYLANLDQAPDASVTKEVFSTEFGVVFGVLLNSWLSHARDQQLLENVLHAIAAMFPLLPNGRAAELSPRLLPSLLGLRRRAKGGSVAIIPLPVTRCLASVLAQLVIDASGSTALEPCLDNLLSALNELVFEAPDLEQPLTIKNHYESLRCFDILARRFPDKVSNHLTVHLKAASEKDRSRSLVILAHLVSCDHTERQLPDLAAAVRTLINDNSIKVKRAVVKVVVVLAHKGHLSDLDGADFLMFIIKNTLSISPNIKADASHSAEREELRQVCCDSLVLLSSAAPQLAPLLQPLLLKCLMDTEYSSVSGLLARCLNAIAARAGEEVAPSLNNQNLPTSQDILARCLVLLGSPLPDIGVHILQFLKSTKLIELPMEQAVWNEKITGLLNLLQSSVWNIVEWEEGLLELSRQLSRDLTPEMILELSQSLIKQGQQPLEAPKRRSQLISLACLAAITADSKLAATLCQDALDAARLFPECEQICGDAIAECACGSNDGNTRHLQLILSQLRLTAKDLPNPMSSSSTAMKLLPAFFANIGSADRTRKSELAASSERLRSAIILSYGELAKHAPGVELLPKLESAGIIEWILQQLQVTKDETVRLSALQTLCYVARAFHPNCNSGLIVFESREKALTLAMGQMTLGMKNVTDLSLSLATALVELPPSLDTDSRLLVLKAALDKVFNSLAEVCEDTSLLVGVEKLCGAAMLSAGVTPASLDELLTLLEPWLRAPSLVQRTSATSVLASALACYANHLQFGFQNPSSFSVASNVLSAVIPRCTDLSPECRSAAVRCVRLALLIAQSYEGRQSSDVEEELEAALGENSQVAAIYSDDPNTLYEATVHLAKVICCHLPQHQLGGFVEGLVGSLTDSEAVSSAGTSVVLNTVLREKGGDLHHHTADILALIIRHLPEISAESTKTGVIHCTTSLAHHHVKAVTLALMHQPLPYSSCVKSCWKVLAKEKELAGEVCGCLLSVLSSNPLCEEPRDKSSPRVSLPTPLAAVSGLHEIFECAAEPVCEYAASLPVFPELLSALLLALGAFVGACSPVNMPGARLRAAKSTHSLAFIPNRDAYNIVPGRVAFEALHSFLICTDIKKAAESLEHCTKVETGESISSFVGVLPDLISNILQIRPEVAGRLVTSLNKHASSTFDSARVTVTAVISELVGWPHIDPVLLDSLLQQLTESLDDSSTVVRQLALQGLAHVAHLPSPQRDRYTSSVLVALLQGLEDSPGEGIGLGLAQQALAGLNSILPLVDAKQAHDLQASLALRIRPFFTKDNCNVRAAAFQTLGKLAECGIQTEPTVAFVEQLINSLINLILGLCDQDAAVIKACKSTLRKISPFLKADQCAVFLQEHMIDEGCLQFPHFATTLVKLMAEEMPDQFPYFVMTSMGFTRSQWAETRSSAALLTGLLHGSLPPSQVQHVSLDSVCSRLTQLLTDPIPSVRISAALAISQVFHT